MIKLQKIIIHLILMIAFSFIYSTNVWADASLFDNLKLTESDMPGYVLEEESVINNSFIFPIDLI